MVCQAFFNGFSDFSDGRHFCHMPAYQCNPRSFQGFFFRLIRFVSSNVRFVVQFGGVINRSIFITHYEIKRLLRYPVMPSARVGKNLAHAYLSKNDFFRMCAFQTEKHFSFRFAHQIFLFVRPRFVYLKILCVSLEKQTSGYGNYCQNNYSPSHGVPQS